MINSIVLTEGTKEFEIMEYKNFSSKFVLQTEAKYKNNKKQTRLQELLRCDMSFQSSVKNIFRQSFLLPTF